MSNNTGDKKECAIPNCAIHDHQGTAGGTGRQWDGIFPPADKPVSERASVEVAISGESIQRQDRCTGCRRPMLYRCELNGEPYEMFCENSLCHLFLIEIGL